MSQKGPTPTPQPPKPGPSASGNPAAPAKPATAAGANPPATPKPGGTAGAGVAPKPASSVAPGAKPSSAPAAPVKPSAGGTGTAKPAVNPVQRVPAPSPQGVTPAAQARKPTPTPARPGAGSSAPAKAAPVSDKAGDKRPAEKASGGRRKLGQILVDLGYIDEDQLWELLNESRALQQPIGQVALARGLITEQQLLQALAEQFNLKVVNLQEVKPQPEAVQAVPETMASVYKVLPLAFKDSVLTVAIADPANLPALDDLRNFLGIKQVVPVLASAKALQEAIPKAYAGKEESIIDIIQQLEKDPEIGKHLRQRETSIDLESLQELQDAAPVRKLINMVLLMGIKDRASDIHFEPFEEEYKLRYRCDGVMYELVPPPRHLAPAISSRIKVMANLDIAERRMPQDGRIELNVGGNPVDLRVSVLPTMFGESVVIRILDRTVVQLDLDRLGMEPDTLARFRELIRKPNGIILVTGPTGSGKSTTLYSALNELNSPTDKIITTEDPIEYDIDGIVQVPINPEIGVTFANVLRAILRHDPDIIMVGEIRDVETAQIAVQASLTGHLVLTTLHTNDAPSSVTRLRDMGVEPYLITATLEGVLAQRLVRRICPDCRTEYQPSKELLMELNLTPEQVHGKKFYYGRGCERCNNTGFKGRTGIFELLVMSDPIRDLIANNASADAIRQAARKMGMTTLREAGLRALFSGVTTIEEVARETAFEDES
ncbi:MAG: type II secretion system ATPase GspE [Gemmatales bacterium]|nr:type II secretion system ATPase GspE [Gemmatales bacterium]MCS7159235.1 type II secretion system ATPase GspE [Gemmatales bacterium]MDW8174435.1 type II secretion system ATPase GspE [Gemmatales bacterium]MDW8222540.1 type II secretion system ATPase GspE [Gemmatales bacterium]